MEIKNKLVKEVISKIIEKALKKKIRQNVNVQISEIKRSTIAEKTHLQLNVDIEMATSDLKRFLGSKWKYFKLFL